MEGKYFVFIFQVIRFGLCSSLFQHSITHTDADVYLFTISFSLALLSSVTIKSHLMCLTRFYFLEQWACLHDLVHLEKGRRRRKYQHQERKVTSFKIIFSMQEFEPRIHKFHDYSKETSVLLHAKASESRLFNHFSGCTLKPMLMLLLCVSVFFSRVEWHHHDL